ncbi:MAG: carboxypeptidase-like regulatory domain-containing protein [Bdellovibrionales bacterium]
MKYLIALIIATAWAATGPQKIVIHEKTDEESTTKKDLQPEPLTDNEVQAVGAAVSAVLRTVMTPAAKASSVKGRCSYRGGFCPGALVELKDGRGQLLASQSLSSADGFVFSNLKPGRYNLEVSYPRYKLKTVRKQVSPGIEVLVEITE